MLCVERINRVTNYITVTNKENFMDSFFKNFEALRRCSFDFSTKIEGFWVENISKHIRVAKKHDILSRVRK